ncbi:MAG: Plastocyanin-like protein [Acidobacteriales bacterium]|nr:Plastocyanin-like protein [Terriglobales bacterium]
MMIALPALTPDHIHPILVNFTAALVPVSFLCDVGGRLTRKESLHHAAWWTIALAAAITPFTALAGLWWKQSVAAALPPTTLMTHQWLGISLAVLFIVLALWRSSIHKKDGAPGIPYLLLALLFVFALMYQGSLGGEMVFG